MSSIILQYILVVLLVVGLGYFMYLLKDKKVKFNEDYFGISYSILNSLGETEGTVENVKKVLRIVSKAVLYVEHNYKSEDNNIKEDKALAFAREALRDLKLSKTIDDDSIRYIIRLSAAFLSPTNENIDSTKNN